MPNLKIFVDQSGLADVQPALAALLPDLRARLCEALGVGISASQVAVLPVLGMPDQPSINVELTLLSGPSRSREALVELAQEVQARMDAATGAHAAVRIATVDPSGYVACK